MGRCGLHHCGSIAAGRAGGFTILEVSAVLLILAVAAAAVALRVQGPLTTARAGDLVGQVQQADWATRHACRQQDRSLRLVVDVSAGRIARADAEGRELAGLVRLGAGLKIEKVLLASGEYSAGSQVTVPFSRQGLSPSYAMLLTAGQRRDWIVLAGLTGQLVQVKDENEARAILAAAAPRRHAR